MPSPLTVETSDVEPLLLRLTGDGQQVIRHAFTRSDLGGDLQEELRTWKDAEAVPWRFLMRLCSALREKGSVSEGQSDEAWLHVVTAGSQLVLPSPQRIRDPALEERCVELRLQAQEREYQSLVADITLQERDEKERVGFGGAMREVGYGVHILTVMFTCFVAGCVLGRSISSEPAVQYAVGCVGMIGAMMVEAGLFMIQWPRMHGEDGGTGKKGGEGPELPPAITATMRAALQAGAGATTGGAGAAAGAPGGFLSSSQAEGRAGGPLSPQRVKPGAVGAAQLSTKA